MTDAVAGSAAMGNSRFPSECERHLTESGTLAFRVALSVLRHREDAEDVAQEAVVRSLQRFTSLRDRARFQSWLVRVTWRLALDRRRGDTRRTARNLRLVASDAGSATAEHELIQRERTCRLWAAIDDLPPRLRLPLVLGTLQGHSLDEVASRLGVPVGTIKSQSFEARRQLKQALIRAGVVSVVIAAVAIMTWPRLKSDAFPQIAAPVMQHTARVPSIEGVTRPAPAIAHTVTPRNAQVAEVIPAAGTEPVPPPQDSTNPALPGVTSPAIQTIEIQIVDTRVVLLPTVHVPVVGVPSIEVPAVRSVSAAGSPETHPEKQR